jgi:hypothetical protein
MSTPTTLFTWPRRQRSSWALAGFIFLSLMLHSAPFFLFQTAAPHLTPPPRTAHPVQLLTALAPDGKPSPENDELLRWVAANDPAIVSRVPSVEPPALLEVRYSPSFATPRTPPLGVPAEPTTVQFPPARDPLALILGAEPRAAIPPVEITRQETSVSFSATLAARAPAGIRFSPVAKSAKPIEPARVLVGVTPGGEVRFTFIQQTSGEPALDREAIEFLTALRFANARAIEWGHATIHWGDEIAE